MSDPAAAGETSTDSRVHVDLQPSLGTSYSVPPSVHEAEPPHYRRIDALGMGPASARTSFTKVNETRPGSVLEADGMVDTVGQEEGDGAEQEPEAVPQTPKCGVTFLLISGKRRTMCFEPETTVGRVKELVWSAWPNDSEWNDERPPAPSFLRILHLGKILQDDDTLCKLNFPVSSAPWSAEQGSGTIVHLSIRPYGQANEHDGFKKKSRRRRRGGDGQGGDGSDSEGDGAGCCRCIIC
ncbi:hypothetical protein NEOLEDRAFT_1157604 [Neolentinus lepideus HHB14362 ss-1]|uniref:UBL3-like ubiquitin domain-containing protein n=1 Tax=Neolentinus lepideus HHB14362 ss-1 TaxID=1314782 RepID=A0A165QQ47_9AGAM|nr:hypothetical protein NEOLEDRAFT_1157604 [Neolentinus lepideus HHB14362 ss-1]